MSPVNCSTNSTSHICPLELHVTESGQAYNVILSVVVCDVLPQGPDDDHTQDACAKNQTDRISEREM